MEGILVLASLIFVFIVLPVSIAVLPVVIVVKGTKKLSSMRKEYKEELKQQNKEFNSKLNQNSEEIKNDIKGDK